MSKRIEGYWGPDNGYPMPIPNVLSEEDAIRVSDALALREERALEKRYRGLSYSRITGEMLGCVEYQLDDWSWPGDFRTHYILEHRVKPTDEFLLWLGMYDLVDVDKIEASAIAAYKTKSTNFTISNIPADLPDMFLLMAHDGVLVSPSRDYEVEMSQVPDGTYVARKFESQGKNPIYSADLHRVWR